MPRVSRFVMLFVVVAVGVAGCASADDAGDPADGVDPATEEADAGGDGASGGDPDGADPDSELAAGGGTFSTYGCEPPSLLPGNARESCSATVLAQVFSGLVELDPGTNEPQPLVAASVESDDLVHWTIELEEGWTFHDGSPVTADSFIDAWNLGADPASGLLSVGMFRHIDGWQALQDGEADALTGLAAPDEHTIEVTLSAPFAPFFDQLADPAFYPLPETAFEDLEAFNLAPVGNGRYEMTSREPGQRIELERYQDWAGAQPGRADAISVVLYQELDTAYLDVLGGNLDLMFDVPDHRITEVTEADDLNHREHPTSALTYFGLPLYDDRFAPVELRQALSLAIDREQIVETLLAGAAEPAASVLPPVLDEFRPDACDACGHDPGRAQELFAAAGGFDDTLTIAFNAGSAQDEWIEAVGNQWSSTLGVEVEFVDLQPPDYMERLGAQEMDGPFRLGWALTYASPEYALSDPFRPDGEANLTGFDDPEVARLLDEANAATADEATAGYHAVEDRILEQMPIVPLWFSTNVTVWSDRIDDVIVDGASVPRLERVVVLD